MPLTKSLIADALRRVPLPGSDRVLGAEGVLQSAAACENYGSAKVRLAPAPGPGEMDRLGEAAAQSIRARLSDQGERLASFTLEFVNDAGAVVHTFRYADAAPAARAPGAPVAHAQKGASPGAHAAPSPAGTPAPGDAPAPRRAPEGHRPIAGLATPPGAGPLPDVQRIIAVGAGKGGVGKSTVSVNLAVGLARRGHAVGLMDGDIYGPSAPTLLGLTALEPNVVAGHLQPFLVHGVKAITMGKLVDPDRPLIWRGPMAHGAFKQLVEQTAWGPLDYLIIDLPPGTGDVPLTMAQMLRLTGAVIVCTPQKVAQDDAVRATRMFQQLNVDILGVVENMSYFVADDLDPPREYDLFGRGGAEKMAARLNLPFLGALPLTPALRQNSDRGDPSANFAPGTPLAASLERLVANVETQAGLADVRQGRATPRLNIS